MQTQASHRTTSPPFKEHTADAVGRVRRSFAEIVDALPQPITRASELQHTLSIDKILGWRIYNVIRCADPFAAARYIPGTSGVKSFLGAARKQGVPSTLIDTAETALAEYDKLARVHAGNRKRLDMLLAAHSDEGRAEVEVAHRRLAYEANSFIWGASADTQIRMNFMSFSQTPGQLDLARLGGLIGLQRLRPNVRWPLGTAMCTDDVGGTNPPYTIEPIYDVENPDRAAARLFMSQPRPEIECKRNRGMLSWELLPGAVGKTSAINCVIGEIMRQAAPARRCETNMNATYVTRVRTPARLLVDDHFVNEELCGRMDPTTVVYCNLADNVRDECDRLQVLETVQYMGKASDVLHTPEVPRYSDMISFVFDRVGWDASRFDVYRFRMEYPIMLSEVRVSHPLPY